MQLRSCKLAQRTFHSDVVRPGPKAHSDLMDKAQRHCFAARNLPPFGVFLLGDVKVGVQKLWTVLKEFLVRYS